MLYTLLAALALFIVTNIDDLALLAAFFADPRFSKRAVCAGQLLGMGLLIALSLLCARFAAVVPPHYVGFSGLLPLGIGIAILVRGSDDDDGAPRLPSAYGVLAVAGVTVANGGDNLAAYIPFFASLGIAEIALAVAVFLMLTALWLWIPIWLVEHPVFGAHVQHWGQVLLPWVLIMLGVGIFVGSGTLTFALDTVKTALN